MVMDVAKAIEEEVVLIHQTIKEQVKTHIPQEGMEDDTTQGKILVKDKDKILIHLKN